MIGYVPQDTILLHESVLTNVTLGDPSLTVADVECALESRGMGLRQCNARGMNTVVGERGTRLSGGQRHRIAIAGLVQGQSC